MKRFDNLFVLGLTFLLNPLGALAQVAPADQGTINHRDSNSGARRETARPVRLTVLTTIVLWQKGRTTDIGKPAAEAENGPR